MGVDEVVHCLEHAPLAARGAAVVDSAEGPTPQADVTALVPAEAGQLGALSFADRSPVVSPRVFAPWPAVALRRSSEEVPTSFLRLAETAPLAGDPPDEKAASLALPSAMDRPKALRVVAPYVVVHHEMARHEEGPLEGMPQSQPQGRAVVVHARPGSDGTQAQFPPHSSRTHRSSHTHHLSLDLRVQYQQGVPLPARNVVQEEVPGKLPSLDGRIPCCPPFLDSAGSYS